MLHEVLIYGAGGFARELAWLLETCQTEDEGYALAGFIDDDSNRHGTQVYDLPVMGLADAQARYPDASIAAGIGSPRLRQQIMDRACQAGFAPLTLIHPRVERSKRMTIGRGAVICAGTTLTTDIMLGEQVQINLHCTIGHDVRLDDYATLAPGVHISGCVQLGKRVYVGTGAVIINGTADQPIVIGDDAVIGAGACVTRSVASGLTVVGVPAKALVRA